MVHRGAAEECRRVQLGADRVDLGGSDVGRGRAELEVDLQVGLGSVEKVGREHDGAGLGGRGGELALLGREEVLADGLGLGEGVALIVGTNVEGRIFRERREHLDHVEALEGLGPALIDGIPVCASADSILDVSHIGRLVIVLPETHGWGELEVVITDTSMLNWVVASTEGELVGDDKVEGDGVSAAGLKDTRAGEI